MDVEFLLIEKVDIGEVSAKAENLLCGLSLGVIGEDAGLVHAEGGEIHQAAVVFDGNAVSVGIRDALDLLDRVLHFLCADRAVQILEIKPEKTVSFLKTMQKRKYIRNIELSKKEDTVRILQYHKIYVFKVYCKNCGAEYTMTSEDDYICQYCGHRVIRKNAE